MTETEIEQFKQRLIELKSELETIAQTSEDAAKPVALDQASVGRLSRMDAMQAQQMAMETDHRRITQLSALEGALRRIESDDFGFCFKCDDEIDIRRLNVDPTITRCLKCKDH